MLESDLDDIARAWGHDSEALPPTFPDDPQGAATLRAADVSAAQQFQQALIDKAHGDSKQWHHQAPAPGRAPQPAHPRGVAAGHA